MSGDVSLQAIVQRAVAAGILPAAADSAETAAPDRPWPVLLLTGLGAWLAALPLFGVLALSIGDSLLRGATPYVVGLLVLGGAVLLLRARGMPLFFEQLAVPALLAGGGLSSVGFFEDWRVQGGAAACAAVALLTAAALPRAWLRVLLGALAAQAATIALGPERGFDFGGYDQLGYWPAVHGVLLIWLIASWAQRHAKPAVASALEAIGCGWLLSILFSLAALAGSTFLVGGITGGGEPGALMRASGWRDPILSSALAPPLVSCLLALAAAASAARAWPALRRWSLIVAAAVLVALSWLLPTLGAALLATALTVTTQRWKRAGAATLVAAWIIGSFYYQLAWPLAQKALWLVAAGAVLGLAARLAWSRSNARPFASAPAPAPATPRRKVSAATALIGVALLSTLVVANIGILQKERLIADGQPVFIPLQPADPRSLMQGDFMRLNFIMNNADITVPEATFGASRPRVVMKRDARGVGSFVRPEATPTPLAPGEFLLELTPKNGDWVVVTDAWFFKEGEADRFSAARFGEFRVDAAGRALLVGLADEQLRSIK